MALAMKALAAKDKVLSLIWAKAALEAVQEMEKWLKSKGSPAIIDSMSLPFDLFIVYAALQTHFCISTAAHQSKPVGRIIRIYKRAPRKIFA